MTVTSKPLGMRKDQPVEGLARTPLLRVQGASSAAYRSQAREGRRVRSIRTGQICFARTATAKAMSSALAAARSTIHPELLESMLALQPDPNLRRIVLGALLNVAGPDKGWTKERRVRREDYRNEASPLVAGAIGMSPSLSSARRLTSTRMTHSSREPHDRGAPVRRGATALCQ